MAETVLTEFEQNVEETLHFVRKYLPRVATQEVAQKLAKERKIKELSAYQLIMRVKAGKSHNLDVLLMLKRRANETYLELAGEKFLDSKGREKVAA